MVSFYSRSKPIALLLLFTHRFNFEESHMNLSESGAAPTAVDLTEMEPSAAGHTAAAS